MRHSSHIIRHLFVMNKKTVLFLSAVLMLGLVSSPAMADNRGDDNDERGPYKEMRFEKNDDFFKGKFDDDNFKNFPKDHILMAKIDAVQKAIESKSYADFTKAMTDAGIKDTVSESDFNIITEAYIKAKSGDIKAAQELIKNNNLSPMLHGFIMGRHMQLTDAQKETLKQAEDLIKQGKMDEAKSLLESAGLPKPPVVGEDKNLKKEEIKTILEKAKQLKSEGKEDEAKQVLSDAGIPEKASIKLEKEFNKESHKERTSLVKIFKNFFRIGKNK